MAIGTGLGGMKPFESVRNRRSATAFSVSEQSFVVLSVSCTRFGTISRTQSAYPRHSLYSIWLSIRLSA